MDRVPVKVWTRRCAVAATAGALAVGTLGVPAQAKHVPCGKHKPPHTNCGKHKVMSLKVLAPPDEAAGAWVAAAGAWVAAAGALGAAAGAQAALTTTMPARTSA